MSEKEQNNWFFKSDYLSDNKNNLTLEKRIEILETNNEELNIKMEKIININKKLLNILNKNL